MSEYQYYEFQAYDRLLTDDELSELRSVSTRATITPSSFTNVYHYGDFGGDPNAFMDLYFDAFVYFANWGTRWFMVRVPRTLLDVETALAYWVDDLLTCREVDGNVVISFCVDDAADDEWLVGEGLLGALAAVRPMLMRGDLRALYLGWLLGVQFGVIEDDEQEPPVPPGLAELEPPLHRLAEFLGIDSDLIAAAAERSESRQSQRLPAKRIRAFVRSLPVKQRDALLVRLIGNEDPYLPLTVQRRVVDAGRQRAPSAASRRRAAAEILASARVLATRRKQRDAARRSRQRARQERAQAAARDKHLQSLMGRDESLWADVDRHIATRTPRGYDQAVVHLTDLRDLADLRGEREAFARRLGRLHDQHRRKRTLIDRIEQADLLAETG